MKRKRILLISSSGGHFEQLLMLKKLDVDYDIIWISEKLDNKSELLDYSFKQIGMNIFMPVLILKLIIYTIKSFFILIKERPYAIISTGTLVAVPMLFLGKMFRVKTVFIETFARVYNGSKTGKLVYKFVDLFIYQWKTLENTYPKGIYGGSIY